MTIEETEKEVGAIIESLQNRIAKNPQNRDYEQRLIDARENCENRGKATEKNPRQMRGKMGEERRR